MHRNERLLENVSKIYYGVAATVLFLFSIALIGVATWHLVDGVLIGGSLLTQTLESIGLVTIGIAVFDVAKFLVEEEIVRDKERRTIAEARGSLTKFFTIIIVALSIESIVLVFETKLDRVDYLLYPTALMAVSVMALVGLGLFQRLTKRDPAETRADQAEEQADEQADERTEEP